MLVFAEDDDDDDSDTTEAEGLDYPEEGDEDGSFAASSSSSSSSLYSPSTSSYEVYTPDSSDSHRIRLYNWGHRVTEITSEMKELRCSICLEPLVSADSEVVSCFDGCRKFFHYHCVCEQRRCPLCRRPRERM